MKIIERSPSFTMQPTIRTSSNGCFLTMREEGKPGLARLALNSTAVLLLKEIDGSSTIEEIAKRFCMKYRQDYKTSLDWILSFITKMVGNEILVFDKGVKYELIEVDLNDALSPNHACIEVTDSCNLQCAFCYASREGNKTLFEKSTLVRVFDELAEAGTTFVDLTGGEFFTHPDAMDILKEACARFPNIGLMTNGTLIPDEAIEFISRHSDQFFVSVSIDSAKPSLHDKLRGSEGAFERTTRNVKSLVEHGTYVRIASVICDENQWELDEIAQLAKELGVATFTFNYVLGFGKGVAFKAEHNVDASERYYKYVANVLEKHKDIIPLAPDTNANGNNCGAGSNKFTIDTDGFVRPCTVFNKTKLYGNILKQPLSEVLASPTLVRYLDIPAPSDESGCPDSCVYFLDCRRCFARGFLNGVTMTDEGIRYCEWIQNNNLMEDAREFALPCTS